MKIKVGENSGFCSGVKYTVQKAEEYSNENKTIYCLGELVHNERVIDTLKRKGIIFIENIEEIPNNNTVIFRAHGEKKETYEQAKNKNLKVLDLTCGKIRIIRNKIEQKKNEYSIIIIGKKNHPETIGTKSYGEEDTYIIETENDIPIVLKQVLKPKIYIVSQTTFSSQEFDKIIEKIKNEFRGEILVEKTICDATEKRQEETKKLAKEMDKMIIIGGKNSSNSKELYNISKEIQEKTYFIQGMEDLIKDDFQKEDKIGIMAGASTPKIVTEEVISFLENMI